MTKTCVLTSLMLIVFCNFSVKAEEQSVKTLAHKFIEATLAKQQPKASEKEMEHYLSFIAENFIDVHVKSNNYTYDNKAKLRQDLLYKLNDEIHFSKIKIIDEMYGDKVAIIHFIEHSKGKPQHLDTVVEFTFPNILVLEFNDELKINHIRRYKGSSPE